jgi:hypothetical protein
LIPENPFHLIREAGDGMPCLQLHFKGDFQMPMTGLTGIDMRCVGSTARLCEFHDTHVWSLWFQGGILALEDSWVFQNGDDIASAPAWESPDSQAIFQKAICVRCSSIPQTSAP